MGKNLVVILFAIILTSCFILVLLLLNCCHRNLLSYYDRQMHMILRELGSRQSLSSHSNQAILIAKHFRNPIYRVVSIPIELDMMAKSCREDTRQHQDTSSVYAIINSDRGDTHIQLKRNAILNK